MAYTFVDTTPQTDVKEEMPAEALKINGSYIENTMDSRYAVYRTLYVRGRESLISEINAFETGVRDGSSILSKRFPAREITVGYKLQAANNAYFRFAYNQLASILNVQDAECIFYDEQDKFFTGTPQGLEEVEPGSNFVIGEFTILCADPFKYSVKEYEISPTEDNNTTFVLEYNGTYKSFPTLEADFGEENECGSNGQGTGGMTGKADCGFVAWFNDQSKIIQLGDPEEEDGESYEKSQTLFSQSFKSVSGWPSGLSSVWTRNRGNTYVGTTLWGSTNGTVQCAAAYQGASEYYLTDTAWGTRTGGYWYGCNISRTIPADSSGETTATDWTVKWSQKLCIGTATNANTQRGGIQVIVSNSSGSTEKVIAAANMFKGADDAGSNGQIWLHVNDKTAKKITGIDFSYRNARWGNNSDTFQSVKACSMVKSGNTVKFNLGGTSWAITDDGLSDLKANRISIVFLARSTYDPLYHQGVYEVTFTKDNCTTWQDIPNKFTSNDVVTADCGSGAVLLNNAEAPEYGALGNDWESFYLSPGYNQIGFTWSDWCETKPSTKLRYREVYI